MSSASQMTSDSWCDPVADFVALQSKKLLSSVSVNNTPFLSLP